MSHGMRNRAVLAGILGALLLAPSALGQAFFPGNDEIRRRLDERLAHGGGVGVVVGLLEADGSRRFVAAGTSGNGIPLDEHALFEIGSITKPFTATLLSDMAARGEVTLDDPVAKYLPVGTRVPGRGGKSITLATLATHTSGLPRMPTNFRPADPKDPFADYTVARLYEFLASYELTRDPGMLAFAAANLSAGGERLHGAMRAAHAPRVPMKEGQQVGLAWMVARPGARTITWHWGGTGGFRTYLGLDLEARRAVVLLTNASQMWNDFGHNLLDPEAPLAPASADGLFAKLVRNEGLDAALARLRELKAKEPAAWTFEEAHFNAAGYRLLGEKRVEDALKVFTLNTELFPLSGNPWDSLGEALLAAGEKEKAIAAYRRSVELDPRNQNGLAAPGKLTKAP